MKKIALFLVAASMLLMGACQPKDPVPTGPTKLSVVTDDIVTVPYAGQEGVLVEFICDGAWTAASPTTKRPSAAQRSRFQPAN